MTGAIPPYIYADIGGTDRWIWFVLAYLIALAAVCPFVGSLSDLLGRRWVALGGSALVIIGVIVSSTVSSMNPFIAGMTLSGVGAGVCELTSLAVTSELAPTRKRGKYVAVLVFTIIPFCPSVLWGQLIAANAGWRYCGALVGAWNAIGFFGVLFFYFPPPRPNARGLTKRQILAEIDYVGGFLSVVGMILFLGGLQWGGYQVRSFDKRCLQTTDYHTSTSGPRFTSSYLYFSAPSSSSLSPSGKSRAPNSPCSRRASKRSHASWL